MFSSRYGVALWSSWFFGKCLGLKELAVHFGRPPKTRSTTKNIGGAKGFWWLLFLRIFSSIQAHMVQRPWSSPFRTGTTMLALSFHLQKHHSYFAPCSWFHPGWPWCQAISVARTVREQCFLEARKGFRWLRRHWHFGLGSSAVWSCEWYREARKTLWENRRFRHFQHN